MTTTVQMLDEIRADLGTLTSIRRLYPDPPEAINEFPALIVASLGGRSWLSTHDKIVMTEHTIRVELHTQRKELPVDHQVVTAIADDVVIALYKGFVTDRYNGTLVTTGTPRTANNATSAIEYTVGPSEWAGQQTYAMVCDFRVTTEQEIA